MVYLFVDKISVRWYISVEKITIILIIDGGFDENECLSSIEILMSLVGWRWVRWNVDRFDGNIDWFDGI